ncbi:M20 family metallo-hydrolase [Roseovarius sp. PS-C2]|uniref:M20 family metallo-hydrolase n=1 Tax=Roseovarius sp. PS-C2 TaxID=2820814 RepID=UPI001C0C9EB4|nr:M20 family metallo-hydrolase [Roseovarius sp. PS-C2]MBU3261910.1 M20 family metallo-hydrolase [Roseovarius sp. PS-C2]
MKLRVNSDRLWRNLIETARFGGTPDGGVCRLTLSPEDAQVRDWLAEYASKLGCHLSVDRFGNMFVTRPGRRDDLAPVAMGSHLDTQPTGGRFDGILGVLAGLEVLETLTEAGVETEAPVMLVNWTNEEGSRFSPAMMGSAVHAGTQPLDRALACTDAQGISMAQALADHGRPGDMDAGTIPLGAMFELHIEQGPVLEQNKVPVGVVTGVQGMRWYDLRFTGQSAHAGTTPMNHRADAALAAARLMMEMSECARALGGVITFGDISVPRASRNVVAGEVRLTVDARHPTVEGLDGMEQGLTDLVNAAGPVNVEIARLYSSAPVKFDPGCIAAVRKGAEVEQAAWRDIVSGAGHDAVACATIAPTAMIFVPCKDGISHNPAESATQADCGLGAQVLLNAVLDYQPRIVTDGAG